MVENLFFDMHLFALFPTLAVVLALSTAPMALGQSKNPAILFCTA
jgi:hypothetical protein